MEQSISEINMIEIEDEAYQNIVFDVIDSELLIIQRPTVQVYDI